ncbi:MAG: hypothetical protein KF883_12900 [Thermomicrobiales bacterium]|nr:hypothetical protein [Thermomicrobiales bacterium]
MTEERPQGDPGEIVAATQGAELDLIAEEQKAEKKLSSARRRLEKERRSLQKAQERFDERQDDVAKAERALSAAREHRLAGIPSPLRPPGASPARDVRSEPPARD